MTARRGLANTEGGSLSQSQGSVAGAQQDRDLRCDAGGGGELGRPLFCCAA